MTKAKFIPAEAFHPSVFIKDEMKARKWGKLTLAKHMGGDMATDVLALDLYFTCGPTDPDLRLGDLATSLAVAFNVDRDLFINLERSWLDHHTTQARK